MAPAAVTAMKPYDKRGRREERAAIRAVLNAAWDPVGVAGAVPDEYDSYGGVIHVMLRERGDRDWLIEYLLGAERDGMGLRPDRGRAGLVADALLRIPVVAS
jgi:hypothetical protein